MKPRLIFGSRLYGQIVLPLLLTAVVVGVVASIIAVFFLQDLTDKWSVEVADATNAGIVLNLENYSVALRQFAKLVADDPVVVTAVSSEDVVALKSEISRQATALGQDNLMVLDADGAVVVSSGDSGVALGDKPLGESWSATEAAMGKDMYASIGGSETISALEPVGGVGGLPYTVVISRRIDEALISEIAGNMGDGLGFYSANEHRVACAVSDHTDEAMRDKLHMALTVPAPQILEALNAASNGQTVLTNLKIGPRNYRVWARRIQLPQGTGPDSFGYVAGIVSQAVSDEAGRATMYLILIWSVVAVGAFAALGGVVARRVSDPLVQLADGARRVADGDFSLKVHVSGANEVSVLADTFNEMTDSLKDRSESLTKKILELATLYEMSRALGSTLDMDDLLGSVLDSALGIFDLDLGYVSLRDKDTSELVIRAVRGGGRDSAEAVRSSMSEWVVREGRPLIFNPDNAGGEEQIDRVTGAKAALCVPLVSSEGTIGSITVGSSDPEHRFNSDDVRLLSTIGNHMTIAVGNIELFTSLQEAYLATVRSLAAAVDAKDTYTRGHSDRVAAYSILIAERMDLAHEQCIALEMAAYLHDIGKIGIAEDILVKPGKLTDDEMNQMRHHPLIGANILKPVTFPWAITPVVRHHHEHYDGTGYPAGLKGDEIPLLARILTAADSYEAMTSDRPYRAGRTAAEAVAELHRCSGFQFDPRIVDVLTGIVEELELSGESVVGETADEIAPEEARAIFAALVDGLLGSFRRLGGPRLSSNVETELDAYFRIEGMPFRVVRARMTFTDDAPESLDIEVEQMRAALRRLDTVVGRLSGTTLVDHFYADALDGFSARMRQMALLLGFRSTR